MNYALAKKLKEAGFKQGGKGTWYTHLVQDGKGLFGDIYIPTLSELIEACGDKFNKLIQDRNARFGPWMALGLNDKKEIQFSCEGDTPIEAVANLWLALNKPKE